jgi:hypothetical protein
MNACLDGGVASCCGAEDAVSAVVDEKGSVEELLEVDGSAAHDDVAAVIMNMPRVNVVAGEHDPVEGCGLYG